MTSAKIITEIQQLAPSAVVELFILDASSLGGGVYYFHAGTNGLSAVIVWKGIQYLPFPIQATGFDMNGRGQLPRPKLLVANVTGVVTALVLTYQDLVGAKLTRKRTMAKYLDAVNFPGGVNASADTTAEFVDDIFFIDRKSAENKDYVEFELSASLDVFGVSLPRRQIIQNMCAWKYRGTECGYTGTAYFNINDSSVPSASQDYCAKRLSSCKCRFGQSAELPFGGFPAAGMIR